MRCSKEFQRSSMAAKSVLQELDQLRSMLRDPLGLPATAAVLTSPSSAAYSIPARPYTGEKSVDRLGRAIEAAEEEMEAALHRTTEVHKSQLRQKTLEVGELQRSLAAKEREADGLRGSLAAAKRSYEQRLQQLEGQLAARDAELSGLHAQLLALRSEREELASRCQRGLSDISRVEHELGDRTTELSSALRARTEEAAQAQAAAARERKDKELLSLEVGELRRELEALEGEAAAAQQDAAHASNRAQEEFDARRDLEVALERERAAAAMLKETKDIEIGELRRRLKAEHGVRKACERWLKSELKSREEMEGLLLAVRDVALGKGLAAASASAAAAASADEEVGQVQALLASLGAAPGSSAAAAGSPSKVAAAAGGQLLSEREANQSRKEFSKMKALLGEESRRLKSELASAKALLQAKVHSQ